jgi:CheY-like chemotaxis protein
MVVLRDVTERKLAEAALARANSELEERVAERTRELEAEIHRRSRSYLKRAVDAADMGAALTKRLLTFARRRRLSPQHLDLNELVLGLTEILKRSLGEPITLTTMLAGNIWPTRADPSEVENAILNLAINARDAMPSGGSLIIETRNVSAKDVGPELRRGDYVLASVSDTGQGMGPEILERAFEPFFTTKEPGRGTGLGLSTVYGFAEQSGGYATITSEVGKGTTVNLYLPRAEADAAPLRGEAVETIPLAEDSEVVLVVEDNPEVRELTLQRVEGLGYVALEAENGPAAVHILESGAPVQLILSDIVMAGGMSGYDLARWARKHFPRVKIVLATGYAAEEAKGDPDALADTQILRKPYRRAELAIALRDALR